MTQLLAKDDVHVWVADLAQGESYTLQLAMLSSDEKGRAERFIREHDRRRFVAAHSWVRRILSLYTGGDAASIVFDIGEHGKPALAAGTGGDVRFNMSHSGDVALCAVTSACDVGVDVEEICGDVSFDQIAAHFFSAAEQRMLAEVSAESRAETFTRIWVRKEAYLKATGRGIGVDLASFSVSLDDANGSVATIEDGVDWAIRELPAPAGFCAAVATPLPLPLSMRRYGAA